MAADLVESSDVEQTFVHDLESFFWVLFWIVLMQVKTSWNDAKRSSFLATTFSPGVSIGSEGGTTGGDSKKNFLLWESALKEKNFNTPNNSPLHDLLDGLHELLRVRHCDPPHVQQAQSVFAPRVLDGGPPLRDKYDEERAEYDRQLGWLKDHQMMLRQFAKALGSLEWPANDKAVFQDLMPSTTDEIVS